MEPTTTDDPDAVCKNKRWFPLESNPEALNTYISKLGFNTSLFQFVDVYSTEDWALEMVSGRVLALLLLYPITPNQEKFRIEEKQSILSSPAAPSNVWFMKQRIGNACGTIAILHALANLEESISSQLISPESWLGKFYHSCNTDPLMTPIQRAEKLEMDEDIGQLHTDATNDERNQTNRGTTEEDDVDVHFIALVPYCDGYLYELDGRKEGPVRHCATTEETFLKDACQVVQKFMDRDPGEVRFSMMVLTSIPTDNNYY